MVLHDDRSRGTRVSVEVRGKLTRFTIELRDLPRGQRDGAARSITGLAEALSRRWRETGCDPESARRRLPRS